MEYVMSDSQKPAELFRRSLDAFLAKDMRAWADLCAGDVLVEFPFAPAGTPSRLDGRAAIFEYLRNYPKIIDVHEIYSLEIYPTDRPGTVIGEWSVKGHVIPNSNAYNMSYAIFVTVRDGSIVKLPRILEPARAGTGTGGRVVLLERCGSTEAATVERRGEFLQFCASNARSPSCASSPSTAPATPPTANRTA
jgi:uncharacterized protein